MRFTAIYGQLWAGIYQNEVVLKTAKLEWSEGLKRFDNKVIKDALITCRDQNRYPPSLPIFIACCKEKMARRQITTLKIETPERAAPEVAKHHIEQIKAKLQQK